MLEGLGGEAKYMLYKVGQRYLFVIGLKRDVECC